MRCPGCEFYNVPGSTACGRCGSTLRANEIAIDVQPPRATVSAKFWRRLLPGRTAYLLRDEYRQVRHAVDRSLNSIGTAPFPAGCIPRMVAPGWALVHAGERERGWQFMAAYAVLLLISLLLIGSMLGSLFLGLAFSVHAISSFAVLRRGGRTTMSMRLLLAMILASTLFVIEYLPAAYLVTRVATPIWLAYAAEPLAAGDVLILNPNAYSSSPPRAGDVVRYHQGYRQVAIRGFAPNYVIGEGEIIDRVLAGPGDRVQWENGRIWVNGIESPHLPLNPQRVPSGLKWSVPERHYLVLPTTSVALNNQITQEVWQHMGLVNADNILARVYFRTQPLSRWGRIR